ncbi:helix-turn-helix transcriptional regulator [Mycolicibacterium agri]|uniref:Helix-turn-helix transcriptional regulator n=1 Tax=Mycolicibacterium agri TaxID=36811 RepID=A0A2A7NEB3_MYCAG|nr:LuxR C-terminal-related transcriptional regulator [Mycolicibacterium agri]PEG41781.1 helix-turn-helix transcriptional regulator [Mycolicibacterium agri]GFG49984.1 helix-turn-helix transcriptional regulator [Mycolicibacterium agri]
MASEDTDAERAVLLATKVHVPAIGGELVRRCALLEALAAGRGRKLTLLSAPAGWGKTTLLAQWALGSGEDQRFAWLTLDDSDNDPVWFWMYVIAALQQINAGAGNRAVELLRLGADPVQAALPTLLNDLDANTHPMALILDDYHVVVNRAVHEQVAFFISRMPTSFRIVVATRSDPMLPLARLRASGELVEMRSEDLCFGVTEAGVLLNDVLGLALTEEDVALLHQRTEGWAAGLYLAALSLTGRADSSAFIRTFAGDNRHVVDYLMCEVLDGQPPQLRDFLLRSSVLGRLSGALCDAVLHTSGSAAVLETMEHENLFVVPLDMSRRWYRYHQLFGELLRAELKRSRPDEVAVLHRRAAAWFEAEGLVDEALRHLVAAGDIARSADLIAADWVNEVNSGGLSTVSGWLDLLPDESVAGDARLSTARAWVALNVGRFDDARGWIEAVEAQSERGEQGGLDAQLVALHAVYAFKTGDLPAALAAARCAQSLDFGDARQARSAAYNLHGAALYFSGSTGEAQTTFERAVQLADKTGDRRRRIYALGYLALIAAESGQLADAEHHIRWATGVGTDPARGEHFIDAMVSLAAATVLDVRGDRRGAADAAQLAVSLARKGGSILEVAKAMLVNARILTDLGDQQTATASRSEARALLRTSADPATAERLLIAQKRPATAAVNARDESGPVEELTAKELEVLRLLATRLSRREIGARLYVSLNTVKTHQRALYRKLGVECRNEAVTRARELGLL